MGSDTSLQTELSFIKGIAAEYGFPADFINKIIVKHTNPLSRFEMIVNSKLSTENHVMSQVITKS